MIFLAFYNDENSDSLSCNLQISAICGTLLSLLDVGYFLKDSIYIYVNVSLVCACMH